MGDIAKDLASGTAGGAAQLVCGHPFDTIKVQLQSQTPGKPPKYSGSIHVLQKVVAADGFRGLFNGMGAPLATVAATSAVLFAAKGQMEALLRSEPGVPLTITQQTICGAGAGFAISFISCPTELIKCRSDIYMNGFVSDNSLSLLIIARLIVSFLSFFFSFFLKICV